MTLELFRQITEGELGVEYTESYEPDMLAFTQHAPAERVETFLSLDDVARLWRVLRKWEEERRAAGSNPPATESE